MTKVLKDRLPFPTICLAVFSLLLWCFLFRLFLNGSSPLLGDAHPYLGHVRLYLENITRGVYPLWNPADNYGSPNEFFLRRIGEFNPFFWLIVLLNKIGLPFLLSYRLFLCAYYFLGITGFYLLSRRFFQDQQSALTATLILLFSSLGAQAFGSYILFEIVPLIWFSYFVLAFVQTPKKIFLLGSVFALMIINITYIPFYFYTVLFVFILSFIFVFAGQIGIVFPRIKDFVSHNKIFTLICVGLLLISFLPGILWYQQTKDGEIITENRHIGSEDKNPMTISLNRVNQGGIPTNLILDRQLVDIDKLELKDFYIPIFAFLMLFAGIWTRLNRRLVTLFIFWFIIYLIGVADASYVHKFLFTHVPFFKYFRNVQFFLWLALLPVFILFVVEQMRIFVQGCQTSVINRKWMTLWVTTIHMIAAGIFLYSGTTGFSPYAMIIFSLGWMLGQIWSVKRPEALALLLWAAIVIQPFEAYSRFAVIYPPSLQCPYTYSYALNLPSVQEARRIIDTKKKGRTTFPKDVSYFNTRWFYEASTSIDQDILANYMGAPFIIYDNVKQLRDNKGFASLQESMNGFQNIAFVSSNDAPETPIHGALKARIITSADENFKILKYDANSVTVKTDFAETKFLVRTQNYHSQWKAFVDGKQTQLFRTDISDQGLWVPSGEHVIHWQFGPSWRYALAYFLIGLYLVVLGWIIQLCFQYKTSVKK